MGVGEQARRSLDLALAFVLLAFGLSGCAGTAVAKDEAPPASAPERPTPTTWHASSYVRGDLGLRVIDYWSRGPDMRARSLISGHPVVTIVYGGRYVVYDALSRKGVDVGRAPGALASDGRRLRPFAFELDELRREGGEKIEDVRLGRLRAEVWQRTDAAGRRKIWVTADAPQVPVRTQQFDRATGATVETDYSNWTFDLEIPDAFFVPPPDVSLQRFEYDAFVQWALEGGVSPVPILYPDLLHGGAAD
jgi:hypothetical protein